MLKEELNNISGNCKCFCIFTEQESEKTRFLDSEKHYLSVFEFLDDFFRALFSTKTFSMCSPALQKNHSDFYELHEIPSNRQLLVWNLWSISLKNETQFCIFTEHFARVWLIVSFESRRLTSKFITTSSIFSKPTFRFSKPHPVVSIFSKPVIRASKFFTKISIFQSRRFGSDNFIQCVQFCESS